MKDKKRVNFSEDHELNNKLRKFNKRQTQDNRDQLQKIGDRTKTQQEKRVLTHDIFDKAIRKNLDKLD